MIDRDRILHNLNAQQKDAVLHTGSDSLILAGAGAGKTRVLTTKIAYLLTQGVAPYEVLALTFTNKAAREMRGRITDMVGTGLARQIFMGTFHSVFSRWLRRYADRLGYSDNYTIYDSSDSRTVIKHVIADLNLDEKYYKGSLMQALISNAKNAGYTPQTLMTNPHIYQELVTRKISKFDSVYSLYYDRCFHANAMDFDDLLLNMYRLLKNEEDIRADFRARFRYILVDEYQDTNWIQDQIVRLLKGEHTEVTVVGDDAQSIYSFRGAVIDNILNFKKSFPTAVLFKLTKNYRSTSNIVDLANSLIEKNEHRIPKDIEAVSGSGEKTALFGAFSGQEEAQKVAAMIKKLQSDGEDLDEIAILYRTNAQSRLFEEQLRNFGLNYRIYGGQSFFDRKEIKDVMAYLRVMTNPSDDEAFRRIVNVPARGIGATTLDALIIEAQERELPLYTVASSPHMLDGRTKPALIKKLSVFVDLIKELRHDSLTMPLDDFMRKAIILSGIRDMYTDGTIESEGRLDNLDELINAVKDYVDNHYAESDEPVGIEDFVRDMALFTDRDEQDDDAPKVTLMTMHASKGLEYSFVFCVGLEQGIIPSDRCNAPSEIEEERRLLYVAITRAKTKCTLSYATSRTMRGMTNISLPSQFLFDLDPEYIHDATGLLDRSSCRRPIRPMMPERPSTPRSDDSPKRKTRYIGRKTVGVDGPPKSSLSDEIQSSVPESRFTEGDRVFHQHFGGGVVLGFMDSISGTKIIIRFDEGTTRHLILKFAKLEDE